jgi:hypothetical protein
MVVVGLITVDEKLTTPTVWLLVEGSTSRGRPNALTKPCQSSIEPFSSSLFFMADYLETQMENADPNKKLLITVHHPPFSLDSVHGGTPDILTGLDSGIAASGRIPDAVLSGHVHNYQRFSRTINKRMIP